VERFIAMGVRVIEVGSFEVEFGNDLDLFFVWFYLGNPNFEKIGRT
jgi:hypothetical protein